MEKCWEILIYWLESIFHIIVIILQNCLRSKNLWMQVYMSIHISKMYQTTSPLDFVQSNEKSKNYFNSSPPTPKILIEGGWRQRDEARENEGWNKVTLKSVGSLSILKSSSRSKEPPPRRIIQRFDSPQNYSGESSRDNFADWIFHRFDRSSELFEDGKAAI